MNPPEANTATITLPEGMSVADFNKLFDSFNKNRVYTAKRDKCVRTALTNLKARHEPEYQTLLNAELKKVGMPIK